MRNASCQQLAASRGRIGPRRLDLWFCVGQADAGCSGQRHRHKGVPELSEHAQADLALPVQSLVKTLFSTIQCYDRVRRSG